MNKIIYVFVSIVVLLNSCTKNSIVSNGTVPVSPSNFVAVAVYSEQIKLSWTDNSTNEAGFHIGQIIRGGGTWTQILTLGANVSAAFIVGLPVLQN